MKYRKLGSSDLEVSEISLGVVADVLRWRSSSSRRAPAPRRRSTPASISSTPPTSTGAARPRPPGARSSPSAPATPTSSRPRSTARCPTIRPTSGLSAAQIAKQIDASLERLQTDYVDLYQAHRFDVDVPIEETIEALQKVVEQGKARYLGFSEWTPEQIEAAVQIGGPDLFVSSQPQYSMLWQAPEAELFAVCTKYDISQIVWSPSAQGVLTGKYKPGEAHPPGLARGQRRDERLRWTW